MSFPCLMDPSGSDLESSLPQPEIPCLIVEDSQPDSAALEDDPDSSYRALLARRLSSLQPTSHSPVLELISSPAGSRSSQTDSQSEAPQSSHPPGPAILENNETSSSLQEESQVLEVCSLPNRKRCTEGYVSMDSGVDSTTHCVQSEGGTSQFGMLELSESQGLRGESRNSQEEDIAPAAQTESKSKRSEVSSSSSSEPQGRAARELSVHALLHSQGPQASADRDSQDPELLSSQEDLFDAEKTGTGVDSTVSELENQGRPTLTPAHSLRLLHLSGQGTLVNESLSQNSVDFVAPTQDHLSQTPFIVPNSPTEQGADEPMDTSLPPDDQSGRKDDEPMEMDLVPKTHPSASTPVSQNTPVFVLEKPLSLPSQPEFSHDVFVPTQSLEAGSMSPHEAHKKEVTLSSSLSNDRKRPTESGPSNIVSTTVQPKPLSCDQSVTESFQLELSVNTESCVLAPGQAGGSRVEDDSQATQIEELDMLLGTDTSDAVTSQRSQKTGCNGISSVLLKTTADVLPKVPRVPDSLKTPSERARTEECISSQKSDTHKQTPNVDNVNVSVNVPKTGVSQSQPEGSSAKVSSSQQKLETVDLSASSCVQETPSSSNSAPCGLPSQSLSQSVFSQTSRFGTQKDQSPSKNLGGGPSSQPPQRLGDPVTANPRFSQKRGGGSASQEEKTMVAEKEGSEAEDGMEEEGRKQESSGLCLALSQSQVLSPEPMEEEEGEEEGEGSAGREDSCVIVLEESERSSQLLEKEVMSPSFRSPPQPMRSRGAVSTNGTGSQSKLGDSQPALNKVSQADRVGPRELDALRDKSLSDSSGDIPFHFTLPKEGELIGTVVSATPPLFRHSTPNEMTSFPKKSAVAGDISAETAMATSDITAGESGEDTAGGEDGKLSLRMKLVTPVEEGSSDLERFSLQKPPLSDEESSVSKVTTVAKAVTSCLSSPSVFSLVSEAHRQEADDEAQPSGPGTPVRGPLFGSPRQGRISQSHSLLSSQSEPPSSTLSPPAEPSTPGRAAQPGPQTGSTAGEREPSKTPEPSTPTRPTARQRAVSQQTSVDNPTTPSPSKSHQKAFSQQTSFECSGPRSPTGRGEPETPLHRPAAGPAHRRHIRTIQEVRTTVTRTITDVYYEDGREVDRKVTEECEEPVVDSREVDSVPSPCRTVSSLTSGDLADVSSLSSKASSLQHSSVGTSSSSLTGPPPARRPDFIMPPFRGAKTARGGGTAAAQRGGSRGQSLSSPEDDPYTRRGVPRVPDSPVQPEGASFSTSLSSSPEEGSQVGSSFVGLRVVAKWSSNGYFYSGRITKDYGEGRFRLLFDDSYECEVSGKDILLCDPIPVETEVTALLEDEYFSIGLVKGHKTEGKEFYYSVESEGKRQWHSRSAVILSLEQGNSLREQYGLGPYEPSAPLAKASDISLDNLVEGKRRRRGNTGDQGTPSRSASASPRTPGPSGKRKLIGSEEERTPAKRGRRGGGARGGGARGGQRPGVCNTSGSGTDLPREPEDLEGTHGPLPQSPTLFMGFAFMLTASSETDRLTNQLVSEEECVQTAPYNKGYTETQLLAGGGFILLDFNEEQCKAAYQSLLVADQHCRTRKYLQCVASGVPCVSHMWVRDCCKDNKLLNYRNYLLPAGMGPDNSIVEWHPRSSPFKTLRVLLVFEEPVELWAQLLSLMGAASVRQYQSDKDSSDIPEGKFDVVITDRACPPLVLENVTSQNLPLVSPEWLIHSVICGEHLGYHSNPQYHHDYTPSS
ncbi:TP53-binding protein 1 isoform X2 [Hypomesus transpacificus]|uniref:TP53-binding protein 1 isoform X2 n=1 Tax=Hypomesus transpacificus TaxID=137520 RepID=UPI001F07AC14|nr:TP53-binding protein 1 isoform X2 [Hypomesus transpacificus]